MHDARASPNHVGFACQRRSVAAAVVKTKVAEATLARAATAKVDKTNPFMLRKTRK